MNNDQKLLLMKFTNNMRYKSSLRDQQHDNNYSPMYDHASELNLFKLTYFYGK